MCPSCGLPQPPRENCTQCGATLPESPRPVTETTPAPPLVMVRQELDLGDGRKLVFTPEAIEIFGDSPVVFPKVPNALGEGGPGRVPLNAVRRVTFATARAYYALLLCAVALIGGALVPSWPVRVVALAVLAFGAWLFFRARTYVVRFERTSGEPAVLVLGAGSPGSPRGVKAQSVWVDLSEELRRRGIEVPR